ncbi:hypothetical protein PIB30_115868, partial [Stylosanthes scabra]|nr:hypothetical protein [Stylosanthes scabra]
APAAVYGEVLGHHPASRGRPSGAWPRQVYQQDPRSIEGQPDPLRATGTSPSGNSRKPLVVLLGATRIPSKVHSH